MSADMARDKDAIALVKRQSFALTRRLLARQPSTSFS